MRHPLILIFWVLLICGVIVGSLLSAKSPVIAAVGQLPVSGMVLHFAAYLALAWLPVMGFHDYRRGILAGLSMFILGVLLEAGQYFSVGRAVEFADVLANGAGVGCGLVFALAIRSRTTIPTSLQTGGT